MSSLPVALQIRLCPARDRQFDIDGRHAGNQVVFFVGDRRQSCGGDRRLTVTRGPVSGSSRPSVPSNRSETRRSALMFFACSERSEISKSGETS